jgi:hypothetical protein
MGPIRFYSLNSVDLATGRCSLCAESGVEQGRAAHAGRDLVELMPADIVHRF